MGDFNAKIYFLFGTSFIGSLYMAIEILRVAGIYHGPSFGAQG